MILSRLMFTFALLAMLAPAAMAQDAPPATASPAAETPAAESPAAESPESAGAPGDAQKQFDKAFIAWKQTLKEIRELQQKYQVAAEAERPALEQTFQEKIATARKQIPLLKEAAIAAYKAAPNQNKDVTDFIGSMLAEAMNTDAYTEAYALSNMLQKNDADIPRLDLFGGVAAFATNHFDEAEQRLKAAAEKGDLQPSAEGASEFQQRTLQSASMALGVMDEYKKLWAEEEKLRKQEAEANDLPRVKMATSKGDIVIELFENQAPNTVANFVNLVEDGFYDGLAFHRVIGGFMAQGGDPNGDGTGGPDYHIPCECYEDDARSHFRGTLSMAHAGRDTGGSQFFLTFLPTPHLNGRHTAFGRVVDGMEVLAQLQRRQPGSRIPPDKIVKATVERKRDHEYKPKTLPANR